jgi:NAD(P)-dependent dehydrogenase (short-subunit alcohol dehydrogenase family)
VQENDSARRERVEGAFMARDLTGAVVVITGASGGIGRCAAVRFARSRAHLVLAARDSQALDDVAAACEAEGALALAVRTDVRDEAQVDELARSAIERFGRIDVWVNDAGVIAYGPFERVPSEVFRAVIDTNLMGQIHGSRAALRQFRRQGDGTLINMASVWARVSTPDVSAYVTSKFAVRAFSECLRQELADEPRIHVTTLLPQAVDTPIFDNAANYSGRRPRPIPPLLSPEEVADGILRCARDPKREVTYRYLGRAVESLHSLWPRLYARVVPPAFSAGNYAEHPAPDSPGNVLAALGAHRVDGGWRRDRRRELLRAGLAAARAGFGGLLRGPGQNR